VVNLRLRRSSDALVIDLAVPEPQDPEELATVVEDIADRVGALEGTMSRTPDTNGWLIKAVIPCAS
jgi:hypothetical protein